MLKVYYADISGISVNGDYLLSEYRRERLRRLSRPELMRECIGAELLLNYAVTQSFPGTLLPLRISAGEKGKPYADGLPFYFNLSHSKNRAACAISDSEVGVDIQFAEKSDLRIAERFFTRNEYELILSSDDKDRAFTEIWCKKESYIKALGTGLSTPLDSFSVPDRTDIFHWRIGDYSIAVCSPLSEQTPELIETVL